MDFSITQKKQEELEKRMASLGIREQDIQEKYVRSSGPGGQKVNKTASCVYLKHVPTGLEIKMQRERSQGLNRYYARKRLCELLEQEQLGSWLRGAIANLKEPYRSLVVLRDVQQNSYRDVAQALELSMDQVKVYLHRARRQLRDNLQEVRT